MTRLPQTDAAAEVKKVKIPVQRMNRPTRYVETTSRLFWNCMANSGRPGDIIGPRLGRYQDQHCTQCR